jgi:tetratricopeptide (TPR) repeat protein
MADIDWAIELEPGNLGAVYTRALVNMDLRRFGEALVDLQRVLERRPRTLLARWALAQVLLRLAREEEAVAAVDKGVGDHPDSDLALRQRAVLLLFMGRTDEALATAQRAVEHTPKNAWNYLCRARTILNGVGGCDRAVEDLATARALAPDDPAVANDIAWHLAAMVHRQCPDKYDGVLVLDLSRWAVEDQPGGVYPQLTRGIALYRAGRFQEAHDALARAVELRAPTPEPAELFALAMAKWKLGDADEARLDYRRAVARTRATYPRLPEYRLLREEAGQLLGISWR